MTMTDVEREELAAYTRGYQAGLETAAQRLETANDETSRICIIKAIRELKTLLGESANALGQ
jgi:hypothetical protein